jgi:hypothetical protein
MTLLGNRDTRDNVILTGIDASLLEKYRLADGTTYDQVVAMANAMLSGFNGTISNDDFWSMLVSYTDNPEARYSVGNSASMVPHAEYTRPDPVRAEMAGHMLPLRKWDHMLGWTTDYLEEARITDIEADLSLAIEAAGNRWRMSLLQRLLKRGDDSGAVNGLSATGLSPGFATAAANTGVDFIPPSYAGIKFTDAHEHYAPDAGGAFTLAIFQDAAAELREHGHEPPYEFLISPADETVVTAISPGFLSVNEALVNAGILAAQVNFSGATVNGKRPIGAISDFRVWVVPGMPDNYGFGFKSYGPNNPRNPLRIRVPAGMTTPRLMLIRDSFNPGIVPVQNLMTQIAFGVGVGDRTNGTPRYVGGAAWTDGTAS